MLSFKQLREMMKMQGSGTLAVREELVSSFTRLHLSVRGTVRFVVGTEEKVVVETDDNLLDYVQALNSGRTLYVTAENKLRAPAFTDLTVTIYLRQLQCLRVACDGDLISPDVLRVDQPLEVTIQSNGNTSLRLEAPALTVDIASDGDVTLAGAADDVQLKVTSNGSLHAAGLVCQHLKLRNRSNGNITVRAEQTIEIHHGGNGYVHYAGGARLTDVNHRGSGPVRHVE